MFMACQCFFNVVDPPKLIEDLEENPFVNHALTSVCCELYDIYGMYLSPLTALLTTLKHVNFTNNITRIKRNGKWRVQN